MGQGQGQSLADIRAKFQAREKTVVLVMDGGLLDQHEQLAAELETANRQAASSLAGNTEAREIAERVVDLEARIAEATVTIKVRGIGRNQFRRLLADHPGEDSDPFDRETFPLALIAACSLDPVLTEADARELGDLLTDGQWDAVYQACFDACREVDGVPFSALASIMTRA